MKLPGLLLPSTIVTVTLCCLDCIVTTCVANQSVGCPDSCICFSPDTLGGSVVNCSARGLTSLPGHFPEDSVELQADENLLQKLEPLPVLSKLQRLSLNHCQLKVLNSDAQPLSVHSDNLPTLLVLALSGNKLHIVPPYLPATLQTLHLDHNSIGQVYSSHLHHLRNLRELFLGHNFIVHLPASIFLWPDSGDGNPETYMPSLEKLVLSGNQIAELEPGTFQTLKILTGLALSNNRLTHLQIGTFTGLTELQHLDLSNNHLLTVDNNTFKGLQSLKHLYLNNNRLSTVPWGLPMLEWLDLSSNLLQNFPEDFKSDLFPAEVFNIAQNPLICDCHLLWVKELYDRREYLFRHLNIDPVDFIPVCHGPPSVAGESWDVLSDSFFICGEPAGDPSRNVASSSAVPDSGHLLGKLGVKCGTVTDTTIEVHWNIEGSTTFSTFYVHYYIFGMRSKTSKFTEVSLKKRRLTLDSLHPETNYVVCLIPKVVETDPEKLSPLSLDHCIETRTKEPPPILIISYLTVFWYYLLGMLATVIALFSCIGGLALVYSVVCSKTTGQWSARYTSPEMDALDPMDAEGVPSGSEPISNAIKMNKPHAD